MFCKPYLGCFSKSFLNVIIILISYLLKIRSTFGLMSPRDLIALCAYSEQHIQQIIKAVYLWVNASAENS